MKKRVIVILSVLAAIALLVLLTANAHIMLPKSASVTIEFNYDYTGTHVEAVLTPEESARVIEILKGGYTSTQLGSVPSCGFSSDIAIVIGPFRFLPANDTCNWFACGTTLLMLNVSKEEMAEIHAIFEKYGGFFPCT